MDELNGRMMACQILITGLIARVANEQPDPLRFLTDFRDEIKAVVKGVNITGMDNTDRVRQVAQSMVDELLSRKEFACRETRVANRGGYLFNLQSRTRYPGI